MEKKNSALVVGAGVSGLQAALDLAETGFYVYLVEKNPNSGGRLPQLDFQFPTDTCEMCKILPVSADLTEFCLKRGIFHPNINFIPNAEVIEFSGNPGDFTAKLNIKNQFVIKENCISCGECIKVCPISVRDEFQGRLQMRKAIYVRCPTSVPQIYTIDINACTKCGECVKVCPTKAIELSRREINKTINIGTVILAPGFEEFNPESLSEFGYGRFSNVMTSTQFERALSDAGPYAGKFVRPSDNTVSKKVAFLQCIGSRDQQRDYCSSACCMYAIKEANLLKEIYPDTEITIFFMDLRTFGKDYYKYALEAKKRGIIFVRCRVPAIEENIKTKDLKLKYETEDGKMVREDFNLVVLSVGQCPPGDVKDLAKVFGIELNRFNFAKTNPLIQVETNRPGVYVCGSFREPVAIQEAVIQASAAANKSLNHLSEEVVVSKLDAQREKMAEHIGIFICECGKDISNAIDIEKLIEFNKSFPDVMVSEKISYLCLEQGLEQIRKAISEHQLTSLVFGACAPYKYEPLFVRLGREYAIPAEKIEIIDLREGLAWTSRDKTLNTKKAQSLIAVAYERQRLQEELCISDYQFTKRVLVIGGGPAGIVTALNLTRSGIEVDLIEKTDKLGGNLRDMYNTLTSIQPQKFLDEILQKLGENKKIKVFTNAEIKKVGGQVGSFVAEYVYENNSITSQYGAIVIATGGNEYQPKEYLYGKDQRIITQRELSKKLLDCKTMGLSDNQTIVMIQCVGSLNDEHPYCSRVCCTRAITNALRLKEINPEVNIYILYREMMAYGFREEYFTKAREAGILFLRYEPNKLPQVTVNNNKLELRVDDQILNEKLCINPDLLVLSTGISPNDNRPLAQMLGLPVSKEGFFEEFNIKYRPLEFTISGIFVCGLAHSPMSLEEAITQANAVCTKVKRLLARSSYLSGKYRAEVKDRWCAGCGLCVESCPVHARVMDEIKNVAVVNEAVCLGCGECAVICPSKASKLKGAKDKQILNMIEAALSNGGQ